MKFERNIVREVARSVRSVQRFLQCVVGPRQVGKTTAIETLAKKLGWATIFEAADFSPAPGVEWIEMQWMRARALGAKKQVLLVLDEVQKVRGWSETVKRLWDEERRRQKKSRLSVVLLGSSSLLLHQGMSESLAGRFLLHRCMHWTYPECRAAFGWSLEQWIYFGGYPGAAPLVDNERTWRHYICDALIETAIARDVLQMQTVTKPALLRSLFGFAAGHPAQIFSYNKMLGSLLDAGNTTTLAHYLDLLQSAFLASGLPFYSAGTLRKRGSSPKLVIWNNALVSAFVGMSFAEAQLDGAWWGHLVENAVGSAILNDMPQAHLAWWRVDGQEVDFVLTCGKQVWGIEVKSGRPGKVTGTAAFLRHYPKAKIFIVGSGGVPLNEFFSRPASEWFG